MTDREIRLEVELMSERNRSEVVLEELRIALGRIFELEFSQSGIRIPARPELRVVN